MGNEIIDQTLNMTASCLKFIQSEFREKSKSNYYQFISLLHCPFLFGWPDLSHTYFLLYSFISNNFFFFDRSRKKEHTHIGKFSSIRPFIQKVAQHSFHRDYVKNRMKKNPSVQRVLNEPLHYSIRSTLCNEINESKNKRNNISPALR